MIEAYTRYYQGMTAEEAEADLKAAMAQDQALQARGILASSTEATHQACCRPQHEPCAVEGLSRVV